MTTVPDPCRSLPSRARVLALALVTSAGLIGLLVGLSAARDALPGDTFQIAKRTHASALSSGQGGDLFAHGKPVPKFGVRGKERHGGPLPPLSPPSTRVDDRTPTGAPVSAMAVVAGDRAGAVGCRGPPNRRP